MLIDLILDRKEYEEENPGTTWNDYKEWSETAEGQQAIITAEERGAIISTPYHPKRFYNDLQEECEIFPDIITPVIMSMEYGTEQDVKKALCNYILDNEYNPDICDYINGVEWLKKA